MSTVFFMCYLMTLLGEPMSMIDNELNLIYL